MLFKQIECFLTVARLGSMSRAAEEMFLTQPSLTARLQSLENEIGDELFVRTKWGMRLTEAGREFLPYAERSVASIENGMRHLRELREGTTGHLRIAALPRVSTYTLPTFLEEFSSEHPGIALSVRTGHSQEVLDMVLSEEAQLGLARSMTHPEVENLPLYEEELVLAVNPRHEFARREVVDIRELGEERLILFDRASSSYELTRSLFRDTGVREPRTIELDNIESAKRMVEHQLGISFLPRPSVLRAVAAGRLCVIEVENAPKLQRSIVVLRRKDMPLAGPASAFASLARRMSRNLSEA
ncbi:MAG: LysR family transcriptional regulator [Rubrobacteraceae bacterium]